MSELNNSLKERTIFVSCSSDMSSEAEVIHQVVEEINRQLPEGDRLNIYHWAKSDVTWKTNGTWQEYIPRSSDPRICMVICLLGERLGSPLPEYFPFPAQEISLPSWVRFPWVDNESENSVPLTGAVFELLDAFSKQKESAEKKPEILVYIKADRTLFSNPSLNPDQRLYGFEQLYKKLSDGQVRIRDRNIRQNYDIQIDWLDCFCKNFFKVGRHPYICFGNKDGGNDACLDDLRSRLLKDIPTVLGLRAPVPEARELKSLECYQPNDHDILFGRDLTIIHILERLKALTAAGIPMMVLSGRSGEGKSSVLRAGLIGRLGKGRYPDFGNFHTVLVDSAALGKKDPLANLEKAINEALGGTLWNSPEGFSAIRPEVRSEELASAIKNSIQKMSNGENMQRKRIFTGIDQFEELLVAADEDSHVNASVAELLSAIRILAEDELAWVVIALPSEHLERLNKLVPGLRLETEILGSPGDADIRNIITRSFDAAQIRFTEDEISDLMFDITTWLSRQENPGPVLPLVSVLMKRIVDIKKERQTGFQAVSDNVNLIMDIDSVIDDLCEKAWIDASPSFENLQQDPETAFNRIMRQLVNIVLREGSEMKLLRQCPINHEAVRMARPLVVEMMKKRLLVQSAPGVLRLAHISIIENWDRSVTWYIQERENQLFIAELEIMSQKWRREKDQGRLGRLMTDDKDLDKIENLWISWIDDSDHLPLNYMRECLICNFISSNGSESWKRKSGSGRLGYAIQINDGALLTGYFNKLDLLDKKEQKAIIDYSNDPMGGYTPLHIASATGNLDIVKKLQERDVDLNKTTMNGRTALWLSCYKGYDKIVSFLLACGADATIPDKHGDTPVSAAISSLLLQLQMIKISGDIEKRPDLADKIDVFLTIIGHMKDAGAVLDTTNCGRVREACDIPAIYKNTMIMDLLSELGFSYNYHYSDEKFSIREKEDLSDLISDPSDGTSSIVHYCTGGTPLIRAISAYRNDQVETLLKYGADPNYSVEGETPLLVACRINFVEFANILLKAGADPDKEDKNGLTALHYAAKNGNFELINALLEKGAKINYMGAFGETPLISAISAGNIEVVEFLLRYGADPNLRLENRQTPLIAAVKNGDAKIMEILCRSGAQTDILDHRGISPLMYAVWFANFDAVKTLLSFNANKDLKNSENITALTIAESAYGLSTDERTAIISLLNGEERKGDVA